MDFLFLSAEYCLAFITVLVLVTLPSHSVCVFCLVFCIYHSPSVSCFTEPFLVSVSSFSLSLVFLCCLVVSWINLLPAVSDTVRLNYCSRYRITPLVKPSGYCPPIEDHACWLEYSSVLSSIYLFATVWTRPVMTMPLSNKALQMDPHASHLVGPVTKSMWNISRSMIQMI